MGKIKYVPGMAVVFDSEEEADKFINLVDPEYKKGGKHFIHNYGPKSYFRERCKSNGELNLCYGSSDWNIDVFKFSELEFEEKIEYTAEELWKYLKHMCAPVELGGMTCQDMAKTYGISLGNISIPRVINSLTSDEFIKKSREYYERKKLIKPGTVVKSNKTGRTGILVSDDGELTEVFTKSSSGKGYIVYVWPHNNIEETDRYISGFADFVKTLYKETEEE